MDLSGRRRGEPEPARLGGKGLAGGIRLGPTQHSDGDQPVEHVPLAVLGGGEVHSWIVDGRRLHQPGEQARLPPLSLAGGLPK
jgi:hypothetical protein